jgi:hypothetical protein
MTRGSRFFFLTVLVLIVVVTAAVLLWSWAGQRQSLALQQQPPAAPGAAQSTATLPPGLQRWPDPAAFRHHLQHQAALHRTTKHGFQMPPRVPVDTAPRRAVPRPYVVPPALPHDVDAVVFWADATHPRWRPVYEAAARAENKPYDRERFESPDELKYCLRALAKNAPWLRRIVLVTTFGDAPPWMDPVAAAAATPPVHVYGNADILPPENEARVSFNSNALQLSLDALPDLAPWVLIMDDDLYLTKPIARSHFLHDNSSTPAATNEAFAACGSHGVPPELALAMERTGTQGESSGSGALAGVTYVNFNGPRHPPRFHDFQRNPNLVAGWHKMLNNNYAALAEALGGDFLDQLGCLQPLHNMNLLPSAAWRLARALPGIGPAMERTQRTMFRSGNDVMWYALTIVAFAAGLNVRKKAYGHHYLNWPHRPSRQAFLQRGFSPTAWCACVNNFNGDDPEALRAALERAFPAAAPWEI